MADISLSNNKLKYKSCVKKLSDYTVPQYFYLYSIKRVFFCLLISNTNSDLRL